MICLKLTGIGRTTGASCPSDGGCGGRGDLGSDMQSRTRKPKLADARAVTGAEVSQVVQLFSNPASGGYRARRLRALVRALEACGATVHLCESRDGAPVIRDDATHACVSAGAGTARHV